MFVHLHLCVFYWFGELLLVEALPQGSGRLNPGSRTLVPILSWCPSKLYNFQPTQWTLYPKQWKIFFSRAEKTLSQIVGVFGRSQLMDVSFEEVEVAVT